MAGGLHIIGICGGNCNLVGVWGRFQRIEVCAEVALGRRVEEMGVGFEEARPALRAPAALERDGQEVSERGFLSIVEVVLSR